VRARALALLLLLAVTAGAACASDAGEGRSLPPNDFEELADIFDPQLKPLGLRLTRGALIGIRDGQYVPSDTGTQLAVYVEPTGEHTTAEYAEGIVPSAQVFLPEVFDRWDELEAFDVCQEPLPGVDDRKEPPPVTTIYVSRAEALAFDWKTVTPGELLAAREPARATFTFYVAPEVMTDPGWPAISQGG
jgi:hypothetical protein